jgi:uncharacterized membrane protein
MSADPNQKLRDERGRLLRSHRRRIYWTRHWSIIATALLALYAGLPFAAPTLMKLGATGPGELLYTLYSPMCHQFAFRSLFLYGEQPFYPRAAANDPNFKSFDEYVLESPTFIKLYEAERRAQIARVQSQEVAATYSFQGAADLAAWDNTLMTTARGFRGDERMGYKVAICARDAAIYTAMVFGGVVFIFLRKRLRPVPLLLYVILGLGPIGVDGFSQLLSYPPFEFWPTRETLPEFRVLTGALFGLMNIWLAFPHLERSMQESADEKEAFLASMGD